MVGHAESMAVCDKCFSFKVFGAKCWYYWENKKECSQFKRSPEDEAHFESDELVVIQ